MFLKVHISLGKTPERLFSENDMCVNLLFSLELKCGIDPSKELELNESISTKMRMLEY